MDSRAKARQKAERRYVRRVLRRSALAAIVILIGVCIYAACYPRIQESRIRDDIENGQFDAALTVIAQLDNEERALSLENQCRFAMARADMAAGRYDTAREAFLALGSYENSAQLAADCAWQNGEALFSAGDYAGAQKMFLLIPDYPGVAERTMELKYQQAEALIETDPMMAFSLYQDLGDYKDSLQRVERLAMMITGSEDAAEAMAQLEDMSQAELAAQLTIVTARDNLRLGHLSVGAYHTVGLRADGTVLAAGRNDEGQCNVSAFSSVTQIAAGAYHTVALRSDGTVLATGRNDEGQCEVSAWQNVVQIACGDYATFALLSDGTVAATGYLDYTGLEAWRGVTAISAGSYMTAGIYGAGSAYVTHPAAESDDFSDLLDMALTTGGAVALNRNGQVLANFDGFPSWSSMAEIDAGSQCVLGIGSDGRVMAHFFRAADAFEVAQIENAVCVAAGGGHSAILDANGTVHAFGSNDHGQCDISGWHLN